MDTFDIGHPHPSSTCTDTHTRNFNINPIINNLKWFRGKEKFINQISRIYGIDHILHRRARDRGREKNLMLRVVKSRWKDKERKTAKKESGETLNNFQ